MPPKNSQKGKKLFQKMRKEKEKATSQEPATESDKDVSEAPETIESTESSDQSVMGQDNEDTREPKTSTNNQDEPIVNKPEAVKGSNANDLKDMSQTDLPTESEANEENAPDGPVATVPVKDKFDLIKEGHDASHEHGLDEPKSQPSEDSSKSVEANEITTNLLTDDDDDDLLSSSDEYPGSPQPGHKKTEEASDSAKDIAALRQQVEDLKIQNQSLQNEILRLQGQLDIAHRPELEMSLSPPYQEERLTGPSYQQNNRYRSSSFVEADIYSQGDYASNVADAMCKWEKYQLDLTQWQMVAGIGPSVSF